MNTNRANFSPNTQYNNPAYTVTEEVKAEDVENKKEQEINQINQINHSFEKLSLPLNSFEDKQKKRGCCFRARKKNSNTTFKATYTPYATPSINFKEKINFFINELKKTELLKPLLFRVTSKESNSPVFLLGTCHANIFSCAEEILQKIKTVYQRCQRVHLEMVPSKMKITSFLFHPITMFKAALSLAKLLITLENITDYSNILDEKGLDIQLEKLANKDGKQVLSMETTRTQIKQIKTLNAFNKKNYPEQSSLKKAYNTIYGVHATYTGSLDLLTKDDQPFLEDKILVSRNIGMANKIKSALDSKQKDLFAFGAAHLIGDKGVLNLLTEQGYTVSREDLLPTS